MRCASVALRHSAWTTHLSATRTGAMSRIWVAENIVTRCVLPRLASVARAASAARALWEQFRDDRLFGFLGGLRGLCYAYAGLGADVLLGGATAAVWPLFRCDTRGALLQGQQVPEAYCATEPGTAV